ncbi:MAG TPA: hypothetical protein VM802_07250 [Chitinophaga sp.]|uniref:hypothetical protein n=1 Tax=Chitinophaga sp. TaxID=1869181 RepID=UPI002CCF3A25|nr:hypothetical protein [Chitinophaga sp.]HVI44647.1 hypothetical protein [Chitinophaga sp.]
MSHILDDIRERRKAGTGQALTIMDMVLLSDTETKYSLLSTASHYLNDPEVIKRWIAAIEAETDTKLRADMLYRLACCGLQAIPDKVHFIGLLSDMLQQDEARDIILPLLGKFSVMEKAARQRLRSFYQEQDNADTARLILSWLLIPFDADEEDLVFYNSILPAIDTTDKYFVLNRLLLQDGLTGESITQLLSASEPAAIKDMVLRYCSDRSLVPEEALCALVRTDSSPDIRRGGIQLLAVHGIRSVQVTDTILHAYRQDPDATVKTAALRVFEYSMSLTPDIIHYLCEALLAEKEAAAATQLLYLLAPYTEKNATLTDALWQLLDTNLPIGVAVSIYHILGRMVPYRLPLFEKFQAAYEREQHDQCKAAILGAIAQAVSFGDELNNFYLKALDAPSPQIREWAVRGLLLLPLARSNTPVLAAAAPALLHPELPHQLRLLLAKKISCIPVLPSAAVQVFSKITDQGADDALGAVCNRVQEKAVSQSGGEHINWEQWLHKADVTHDLEGIFPNIWLFFQDNPQMAHRILWACINPAGSGGLYQQSLSDIDILSFLAVNMGVDDDMCRYALNQLLHTDLGNESKFKAYLLIIKGNTSCDELREGLWRLLETRGRYINMIQLDEVLKMIWKDKLEEEFRQRMLQSGNPAGIIPYLKYLSVNCTWPPAPQLLQVVVQAPGMQEDADCKQLFREACRNCIVDAEELLRTAAPQASAPIVEEGPGFAD